MEYGFADLIDMVQIQEICQLFYQVVGVRIAISDRKGNLLASSAWEPVCQQHRMHPVSQHRCQQSDRMLGRQLRAGEKFSLHQCGNGLVDAAVPIYIAGEHMATAFCGQLFFTPPDREYFRRQAREYGFDEEDYLLAIEQVPLINRERLLEVLQYVAALCGMLGQMGLDKLQQVRAQHEMSDEQLKLVVRQIPGLLWRTDRDLVITMGTGLSLLELGVNPDNIPGMSLYEFHNTTDPEFIAVAAHLKALEGESAAYELHHRGHFYEAHVEPLRDGAGMITGTLGIALDITEKKHYQQDIQRQNRTLEALYANTPDAVVIVDHDTRILGINKQFTRLFGYEADECQGKRLLDLTIPPALYEEHYQYKALAMLGPVEPIESKRLTRDGRLLDVQIKIANIDQFGYYVLYSNISERKEIERIIAGQMAELEAKNAELERFVYTVSHDLRSPLITIKGFSGLAEQDMEKGDLPRLRSDLARITRAADKMQNLLDDLLELSRVGRLLNPFTSFTMTMLVDEVIELLQGVLAQRGVTVEVARDMPMVYADRARISEVWQNLVENAVKFMGEQPCPHIAIGWQERPEELVFYVRDNGIGIEPRYHEKIFGLFDQLDHNAEGTGIGLALARRIIEFHQGRIWVESDGQGQGATFFFTLPQTSV